MIDLSKLAIDSMWPTSQAGGNMLAGNEKAMTAPGSAPVDNIQDHLTQTHEDPTVEDSNAVRIPAGTSGKPQASGQQGRNSQPRPAWGATVADDVVRDDSGASKPQPMDSGKGNSSAGTVPMAAHDPRAAERDLRRHMAGAWQVMSGGGG